MYICTLSYMYIFIYLYTFIIGMMCQNSCGRTVQEALNTVTGVQKVIVSFKLKEAQIWGSVNGKIYE